MTLPSMDSFHYALGAIFLLLIGTVIYLISRKASTPAAPAAAPVRLTPRPALLPTDSGQIHEDADPPMTPTEHAATLHAASAALTAATTVDLSKGPPQHILDAAKSVSDAAHRAAEKVHPKEVAK